MTFTTKIWIVSMITTHIWVVMLESQTSFRGETSGDVTKCRLFSQAIGDREEVRINTGTGIPKWVACEQTVLHRLGPNKIELDWKHVL